MSKPAVLYLTYDGLTDALGESQVLSYMEGLSSDHEIHIISFEKKDSYLKRSSHIRNRCEKNGIHWHPLAYTKNPPVLSTVYDIFKMRRAAFGITRRRKMSIVHCRGYISAIVGEQLKKKFGCRFIFDMRGFWIDEKIESGSWKEESLVFKKVISYLRRKEMSFLQGADAVVVLTYAAEKILHSWVPGVEKRIFVIPTCVNLSVFQPFDPSIRARMRKQLGFQDSDLVVVYSGGYGGNYDAAFTKKAFLQIKNINPATRLLILSKDGITGFENDPEVSFTTYSAAYQDVGNYLMAANIGLINYKNSFSVAGRSPTKLGEYWAVGIPALAPEGVGDLHYLFQKYPNGGMEIADKDLSEIVLSQLLGSHGNVRAYAEDYFSLNQGIARYGQIYNHLK